MSDLISRSALQEAILRRLTIGKWADDHLELRPTLTTQELDRLLTDAPALDAVPVVRCKDCKHRGGYHCPMYHTETSLDDLDGFDDYNVDRTDGDGFCHRGEKK